MTSIGYFLVLIAVLQCLSSVDSNSGSGDDSIVPDIVIEFTTNDTVNCTDFESAVVNGYMVFNDTDFFMVEQITNKRKRSTEFNYIGYAINGDLTANDSKTIEIKMAICMNPMLLMDELTGISIEVANCSFASTTVHSTPTQIMQNTTPVMSSSVSTLSTNVQNTTPVVSSTTQITSSILTTSIPTSTNTEPVVSTESKEPATSSPIVQTTKQVVSTGSKEPATSSTSTSETQQPISSSRTTRSILSSSSITEPEQSSEDDSRSSAIELITVVGPASVFGFLLILFIVIVTFMCMVMTVRRMRVNKEKKNHPQMWLETKPVEGNEGVQLTENPRPLRRPSRISYASRGHLLLQTLSHPMSIDELSAAIHNMEELCKEYMRVPPNLIGVHEIPAGTEDKNRYIDVLPNPNSRVPLFLKFGVAHSDYMNANYIRGYKNQPKQYIATQGPIQETVVDFWRMIWEQKVSVIIMTTGLVERNMEKCTRYWPDEKGYGITEVYGEIQVTIRKKTNEDGFIVTTFSVQHVERPVTREVTHYWFVGWPDHGVPKSTTQMVDFLLYTRTKRVEFTMPGPAVVHCSAGIGRSGVFIAADIGMRQLEENMTVDVLRILATMRQDRGGLIQTREQYIFLHKILNEYAKRVGHVSNTAYFHSESVEKAADDDDDDYEEMTELTTFKK